ncbi:MAG: hypothetical protein N2C14_04760, partial [Planctomycetales bacterium]
CCIAIVLTQLLYLGWMATTGRITVRDAHSLTHSLAVTDLSELTPWTSGDGTLLEGGSPEPSLQLAGESFQPAAPAANVDAAIACLKSLPDSERLALLTQLREETESQVRARVARRERE